MKIRVTIENQVYEVEVGNLSARPVLATVDGETFEVWPEHNEQPVEAAPREPAQVVVAPAPHVELRAVAAPKPTPPVASSNGGKGSTVTAPIPGVIISIAVKPGEQVTTGQELCMLEAMKMRNAIRSPQDGTIANVVVAVGDQVRHGQNLIEFAA